MRGNSWRDTKTRRDAVKAEVERAERECPHELVYCVQEPMGDPRSPYWRTCGIYRQRDKAERHAAGIEGAKVWPWIVL